MRQRASRIEPYLLANKYVDGVPFAAKVKNLSESGVALQCAVEPEHREGAHIVLELVIDSVQAPLWLDCKPARFADANTEAFSFVNMNVANRRIVNRFIRGYQL